MIPGSKGLKPNELAHRWVKDLGTRPDMSIKAMYTTSANIAFSGGECKENSEYFARI